MLSFNFLLWLRLSCQRCANNCSSRTLALTDSATDAIIAICRFDRAFDRAFKHLGRANPDTGVTLGAAFLVNGADKAWHPFAAALSVIYISLAVHARIISHYGKAAICLVKPFFYGNLHPFLLAYEMHERICHKR
ncbi:MAG: hypothetical protein A2W80_13935 [Candidatus Riflebacteria bacterium GWC2_50_8]|nr:MAG: hypothetical protein A2W80_13935 [Candidatus Riflebacteria bacterium GWC2_50_8]